MKNADDTITSAVVGAASNDALDMMAFTAMQSNSLDKAAMAFTEMLSRDPADAFAHTWLGRIAVRAGDLTQAEWEYREATLKLEARMVAEDSAETYAVASKKAEIDEALRHVRERIALSERSCSATEPPLRVEAMARVHRKVLGHARFASEFAQARRPVIIEGFEGGLDAEYWSFERLRRVCGEHMVPLRRHAAASSTWAGLQLHGESSLATHLDGLAAGTAAGDLVFDWPLRAAGGCSALLDGLSVPSYFTTGTARKRSDSSHPRGRSRMAELSPLHTFVRRLTRLPVSPLPRV